MIESGDAPPGSLRSRRGCCARAAQGGVEPAGFVPSLPLRDAARKSAKPAAPSSLCPVNPRSVGEPEALRRGWPKGRSLRSATGCFAIALLVHLDAAAVEDGHHGTQVIGEELVGPGCVPQCNRRTPDGVVPSAALRGCYAIPHHARLLASAAKRHLIRPPARKSVEVPSGLPCRSLAPPPSYVEVQVSPVSELRMKVPDRGWVGRGCADAPASCPLADVSDPPTTSVYNGNAAPRK